MDRFAVRLSRVALGWAWLAALALLALALQTDAPAGEPGFVAPSADSMTEKPLPPVAFVVWLIGCRGDTAPTWDCPVHERVESARPVTAASTS